MNKPGSLLDIARHISEEKYRLISLRERLKTLLNDLPPRWHGAIKDEAHRIYAIQERWGHGEYEAHRLWKEYYNIRMALNARGREYDPSDLKIFWGCFYSYGITKKFFIVTLLPAFEKMYESSANQ